MIAFQGLGALGIEVGALRDGLLCGRERRSTPQLGTLLGEAVNDTRNRAQTAR